MTFLTILPDSVLVQMRAEGEGVIGDMTREVRAGESFLGHTYEELRAMGDGGHEIEPKGEQP